MMRSRLMGCFALFLAFVTIGAGAAPPRSSFVVANGVRLQYLDWGGQGDTLLFLSDVGYSSYLFGDIAPRFTDRFHVLAMTWRGHGQSEKTKSGFDSDTLLEDLRQFLDKKGGRRVVIAGHGTAAKQMTELAKLLPDRVAKLVYLDAAYDNNETQAVMSRYEEVLQTLPPPPYPSRDNANFDALRTWSRLRFGCWSKAMEDELKDVTRRLLDGRIENLLSEDAEEKIQLSAAMRPSEFALLKTPALAIYAMDSLESVFPWILPTASPALRTKAASFVEFGNRQKREQIKRFRANGARQVVELPDTSHLCFIQKPDEVVREMRAFLLPGSAKN